MASLQEKAECVTWFIETKSVTKTRRNYQRKYGKVPPSRPSIYRWHKRFVENGTVADGNRSGRPKTQEGTINRIRLEFESSPRTSIRTASRILEVPYTTVHRVLHKSLKMYPYKIQLLQNLQSNDKPRRKQFACDMLTRISEDPALLDKLCFTDEATFHVSGKLNRHNVRIWGKKKSEGNTRK